MRPIEGVYAAALTPRRLGTEDINLAVMWDLVDFLVERKVDGIVLLGSTGEFIHFSTAERMRLIGLAAKRSRVPVLVNVSYSTLDGAVEMAQASAASGAAGVLVMPPYFFRYDQAAIRTFYLKFVEDAGLNIPVFLYNIPQFTNAIEPATIEWLVREGIVQGVKDSSGDRECLGRLLAVRREIAYALMIGSDALYAGARPAGASGIVSGVASAIPELLVALERSIASGTQAPFQARLEEYIQWIDRLPAPVGIKESATIRGLKMGPHATPCSPEQQMLVRAFQEWFQSWLPQVLSECKHV
jgi:dihydrodipicolinate synthase/N-acetylneuraminate lyase